MIPFVSVALVVFAALAITMFGVLYMLIASGILPGAEPPRFRRGRDKDVLCVGSHSFVVASRNNVRPVPAFGNAGFVMKVSVAAGPVAWSRQIGKTSGQIVTSDRVAA